MTRIVLRVGAWGCLAYIVLVTLGPLELRPVSPAGVQLERFIAFAVLGLLFGLAYPKRLLLIACLVVGSAVLLEIAQNLVVGRHGRILDGLVKAAGAVCGVGLAASFRAVVRATRRPSP